MSRAEQADALQAANAGRAGAAAVIIANNNANGYFRLTPDSGAPAPTFPVFSVPLSTYSQISAAIQLGASLSFQLQRYTFPSCKPSKEVACAVFYVRRCNLVSCKPRFAILVYVLTCRRSFLFCMNELADDLHDVAHCLCTMWLTKEEMNNMFKLLFCLPMLPQSRCKGMRCHCH